MILTNLSHLLTMLSRHDFTQNAWPCGVPIHGYVHNLVSFTHFTLSFPNLPQNLHLPSKQETMTRSSAQPPSMPSSQNSPRQREEEEEEEGEGQVGVSREDQEAPPSPRQLPEEPQAQQPRPGILMTAFTFVTSFFTSLVPQQRPELQFN